MARRNVLVAVNKELRGALAGVADTALAEVARQLAREFDAGDRPAATQLTRVLVELRKLATTPAGAGAPVPEEADRVDDLHARRSARLAGAADLDGTAVGDHERRGVRRAR
jgi:hypothetical protein